MVTRQVIEDERPWQATRQPANSPTMEEAMKELAKGIYLGVCAFAIPLFVYVMTTGGL